MPGTTYGVLGALEAVRGGRRLELPRSAKTRALLGYLLVETRPLSREHLCTLLWETSEDARGGLRWSLSKLRPLLDDALGGGLRVGREEAWLEPDDVSVDLWRVRALLARAPAERATEALSEVLALFRGPLLEGLEVREAYRFQAWCAAKREEVKGQHGQVLRSLADRLASDPEAAVPHARGLLELDPSDEEAHRRVMALLVALGRRTEALAQYDVCREVLAATKGSRPAPETEAMRRSFGVGTPALPPTAPATPGPGLPRQPLVGREAECVLLERALRERSASASQAWLVLGEAGIGKTRLLDELAQRMGQAGTVVLRGRAFEAELVRPYGVWVDAIRGAGLLREGAGEFRADLAALFGELGPPPDAADRTRLFDALAGLLAARLPNGQAVVFFDDVHWLDEASSALAHYLLRALPGLRLLAAARPGELAENPGLGRFLRALQHEGTLGELELLRLGRADVAGLLAAQGWRVDAEAVHRASAGNPLLALEVGRALSEGRRLLDESLEQLVLQRVVDLDARTRALLDWAAALGRTWPLALLARASGETGTAFLDVLGRLERRGILRPLEDERYEFTHDLVREAVYGQLPPARRAFLHKHLAASLEGELDTSPGLAGAVAHHALLGGEDALMVKASLVAARHALRVCAEAEAHALADRALPLVSCLPLAEQLRVRMEFHEVRLLTRRLERGEVSETREEVLRLLAQAQNAGLAEVEAAGYALLAHEAYTRHDSPTALPMSLLGAQAARLAVDPEARARALAQAGRCLAMVGRDPERCAQLLDEAEAEARRTGSRVPDIALGRGLVAHVLGQTAEARLQLEQAAAQAQELGDAWRQTEALFDLTRMSLELGDLAHARSDIERALLPAERLAAGSEPAVARGLTALVELLEARAAASPEEGPVARFDEACAELERIDAGFRIVRLLLLRAEADVAAGRAEEVVRATRQIGAFLPRLEDQSVPAEVHSLLAGACLARGDAGEARQHLARARTALVPLATVPCFLRQRIDRLAAKLARSEAGGPP